MEGPLLAVLGHDGSLLRTLACPIPAERRSRLRGATVICESNHCQVVIDGETAAVVPRTTTSQNPPLQSQHRR